MNDERVRKLIRMADEAGADIADRILFINYNMLVPKSYGMTIVRSKLLPADAMELTFRCKQQNSVWSLK